jgi:glycosyltransferase involved in cell wall biosynthesis
MVKQYLLTRRNLRDLIIVLSLGSAIFIDTGSAVKCIAVGMLGLGCFIHCVSKGTLIRNVVLCTEGIYCVVRHPYYLANYLIDWSFCLLSGNLFLLVSYPFLFFLAYGPTMRFEEQLLFTEHGESFVKSTLKTPQIFPDISSFRNIKVLFKGFSVKRITHKECSRIMRFFATGTFLIFFHSVRDRVIPILYNNRFSPIRDLDEFLLILLVLLLIGFYIAGSIVLSMSNRDGDISQGTRSS